MQPKTPRGAYLFSLAGSIIILISAIIEFVFSAAFTFIPFIGLIGIPIVVLSIIGIIVSVVALVLSAKLGGLTNEDTVHVIGAVLLILSIVSFFTALMGGFVLGFLLLLIGSIMALTWKP
ncbi:hypothetical protein [Caldivirga sp. UBA161]|uniref:hypothetical protein n=1 Tax=Caldivirga sp. UBA161 TaxID=1915569 RepID=UPI0025C46DE1|nr:hypothetical protein [Caldivirga sp. UBA161]